MKVTLIVMKNRVTTRLTSAENVFGMSVNGFFVCARHQQCDGIYTVVAVKYEINCV